LWTNELIGVLWEGNNMFEGVAESMKLLREKGWKKTFDINVY
jgi:ribonucleotide monophosphatase NagD (HAD superfamily)